MLQTEEKKTKALPFKAFCSMFDWAADQLRIAIPTNVHDALMSCEGRHAFGYDSVPRIHHNTLQQFKRLPRDKRVELVQRWFDAIEPGFVYSPPHTYWF